MLASASVDKKPIALKNHVIVILVIGYIEFFTSMKRNIFREISQPPCIPSPTTFGGGGFLIVSSFLEPTLCLFIIFLFLLYL